MQSIADGPIGWCRRRSVRRTTSQSMPLMPVPFPHEARPVRALERTNLHRPFAAQQAAQSIYRPKGNFLETPDEDEVFDSVTRNSRFEVLGRAAKGFKGSEDADARDGPVQFEKDQDTFGIDAFLGDVKKQVDSDQGKRKMGLSTQEQRKEDKASKRRRYSDED